MNILLINQNWFEQEFTSFGHRVISFGQFEWLDVRDSRSILRWEDLLKQLPADFLPELVVFYDDSAPINILNLEQIKVPTIFYSVDTHHHQNFHLQLGLFFTHLFIAQKDYLPEFNKIGIKANWLPLWASRSIEPKQDKDFDSVFVGTLDKTLNPERVSFFERLQQITDIKVLTGDFSEIFPKSRIVVNQTVKKDLNFRVFETMMSGAMLLTEKIENGLNDLFVEGQHLVCYEKGNVEDAAEKIAFYLSNKNLLEEIARTGRDCILNQHLPVHRAKSILEAISQSSRPTPEANYYGLVANFATLGKSALRQGDKLLASACNFEALRLMILAAQSGHEMVSESPMFILTVISALRGDLSDQAINDLYDLLITTYPAQTIFKLAKLGFLSLSQQTGPAQALARDLNPESVDSLIVSAESFMKFFEPCPSTT